MPAKMQSVDPQKSRTGLLVFQTLQPLIRSHETARHVVAQFSNLPRHLIYGCIRCRHVLVQGLDAIR